MFPSASFGKREEPKGKNRTYPPSSIYNPESANRQIVLRQGPAVVIKKNALISGR
jgi:hypothetical protein